MRLGGTHSPRRSPTAALGRRAGWPRGRTGCPRGHAGWRRGRSGCPRGRAGERGSAPCWRRPWLRSHFPALTNVAFDGEPSGSAPRGRPPGGGRALEWVLSHGTEGCLKPTQRQPAHGHPTHARRNHHFRPCSRGSRGSARL